MEAANRWRGLGDLLGHAHHPADEHPRPQEGAGAEGEHEQRGVDGQLGVQHPADLGVLVLGKALLQVGVLREVLPMVRGVADALDGQQLGPEVELYGVGPLALPGALGDIEGVVVWRWAASRFCRALCRALIERAVASTSSSSMPE